MNQESSKFLEVIASCTWLTCCQSQKLSALLFFPPIDIIHQIDRQIHQISTVQHCVMFADKMAKVAVLLFQDQSNITENSVLSLNMIYSNKRTKFKISAAIQKETPQVCLCLCNCSISKQSTIFCSCLLKALFERYAHYNDG